MRKVKVYSTAFGLKPINSSATTWGELQNDLDTHNITYSGMNAVENVGNTTLMLNEARLPEGEFVLMLTPQKTKSGSDYKTIRATVVEIITKYGVPAKEHFNQGKNYTNKSAAELLGLIALWNEKHPKSATPKLKVDSTTPKVQTTIFAEAKKKMSFVEVLRLVLTYGEVNEYDELRFSILDALDSEENDGINETFTSHEDLSNEELSWINKIKNM